MEKMASGSVLIALAGMRNTEAQLRWQGAQKVLALNITALAAILYRWLSVPDSTEFFALAFGCAIVALLDYEWYAVLRRDGQLLDFWNQAIINLENEAKFDDAGSFRIFTSDGYARLATSRRRLQRTLERLTVVFIYVWGILSVILCTWAFALVLLHGGVK